jgi:hypothetical protein
MLFILEEFSDCLEIWKFLTETVWYLRFALIRLNVTIYMLTSIKIVQGEYEKR